MHLVDTGVLGAWGNAQEFATGAVPQAPAPFFLTTSIQPQRLANSRIVQSIGDESGAGEVVVASVTIGHGDGESARVHRCAAAVGAVFENHHL